MTIGKLAESLHVSRSTVYKKLKDAGVDVNTLRTGTGELSSDGIIIVSSMFDNVSSDTDAQTQVPASDNGNDNDLTLRLMAAQSQIEVLQVKLDAANATIEALQGQLADAKKDKDDWREQAVKASERLLAATEASSRSWWSRVFGSRIKK